MMGKNENVFWHQADITREDRERVNGHKGATIWLTGLSASGKSTIAVLLEKKLFERGCHTIVLDGDNIRHGLNKNLGFCKEDREENIRRIAELAKLFTSKGIINITAFISPYRSDRARARSIQKDGDFLEVFVDCPIGVCEKRDPKGLYKKARAGEVKGFTGVGDPYEKPEVPELVLETGNLTPHQCVDKIIACLVEKHIIRAPKTDFITVVSGLPRTGTSMMMKMLETGGMGVVTDNVRQADIGNPEGYYEFEKVKELKEDISWLAGAQGKVFKMVSMLLYDLPRDFHFKVVFMERDLDEVLISQRKMLDKLGKAGGEKDDAETKVRYVRHIAAMKEWLAGQPNFEVLYMDYNELIAFPHENARKLGRFFGNSLNAGEMASVIKPELYRNRAGKLLGAGVSKAEDSEDEHIKERLKDLGYI
jgi:adenylylsulfate kinase